MKQNLVILLGLKGLTPAALVEKGRNHIEDCTGNADLTLPANFLTDFAAACDALEAANMAVSQNGGKTDTLLRNKRRDEVEEFVRKLAGYVEAQCTNDEEKIVGTGFTVRPASAPIGLPAAPQNLRAKRGVLAGEVGLRWDRVPGRLMYEVWINAGDPNVEAGWTLLTQTSKNYLVADGLTTDAVYYFRVQAIGTAGAGPASDSAVSKAA
ncbi:MAG: fibronectin type III domain-containing protein [Flavobacteriales bacterium]|jgi:hypothetical protein|nr:fibronectin type III domain-containing protein [Flavobacteriales bacterium]